jgi:aerobic carbon-monoxide dehydrogenase medium subunit
MKPAPFEYYAPTTIDEALSLLSEHGYDAKTLAGGQSLIPMMNFRLVQPALLVDINNIPSLSGIHLDEEGDLHIGAMTRHAQVESDPLVAQVAPLVSETIPHIATSQIRNRGTFGGSIAHADPSAELTAVSVALNGRFLLRSQSNERWVPADEFFLGMFSTILEPDEILVEAAFSPQPPRSGWSMVEISRRPHDFALVGVAAVMTLDDGETCQAVRIVYLSVGDRPVEAHRGADGLINQVPTVEAIRAAAEIAAAEDIDPSSDIHASAEFRRHLVKVLTQRALKTAFERAKGYSH